MKTLRIKVIGNDFGVIQMLRYNSTRGYTPLLNDIHEAPDLFLFTGGADVDPDLYGEKALPCTHFDRSRDDRELAIFSRYIDTPKVGICRGGQFLNVVNGGKMWQDVNNHGLAMGHKMVNLLPGLEDFSVGQEIFVTSTHHQMMISGEGGTVIGIAENQEKTAGIATKYVSAENRAAPKFDTEVVWYDATKSLCFQPHPEYRKSSDMEKYFFDLLDYFFRGE